METQELVLTAVRAVGVYVFMLVVIRLLGKREVGSFSAFDLLVALMLGEIVDEIIYGDVSFPQGIIAIVVIALCQYVTGWLTYLNHKMDNILEGVPTIVVRVGEFQRPGMRKERMNEQEVMSQLREQSIDDMREVKLAVVETSGQMSVIKQDWAEPVQKADLGGEEAKQKEQTIGGQEEPPSDKDTTSKRALSGEE